MYNLAIVDDCDLDIQIMKNKLKEYAMKFQIELTIDTYLDSQTFSFDHYYDAIFLDIDMPHKNGLILAKEINQKYKTKIIFMTNFSEYMHLTFEVRPFHFIHKEYINDEIEPILRLLFQSLKKEFIIVNNHKICFSDIILIKIDDHFCEIQTIDHTYSSWQSLSSIYQQIDHKIFQKANQSVIVNMDFIQEINNKIILKNHTSISLSRRMRKEFIHNYQIYLMENL